jgi:DeoR/GlpR family transcriptional regulator of sugar metabolism
VSGQPEGRAVIADVRREGIAEMLRIAGSVTVVDVEERYAVSSMTARRDLAELERRGLARRTHGGAVLPAITSHEDSFKSRMHRSSAAKARLGKAAAAMVGEGETLFLDSSSTAYHVARALLDAGGRHTIITNSQPIMDLVASHPTSESELIGIGGTLRRLTRSFVGPGATGAVQAHFADRVFFSIKGLARDGELTDADVLEAEVKRRMVERAEDAVLLIDGTKLASRGLSVIAHISAVGQVVAADLDAEGAARLAAHGIPVLTADADPEAGS